MANSSTDPASTDPSNTFSADTLSVQRLRATPRPEELVIECARGDYLDGVVNETPFHKLIEDVEYDDPHTEWAHEYADSLDVPPLSDNARRIDRLAKKYAFLERLFRRGHFGPFEHPQITFSVGGASRSCMAQITRHRHVSFDVQSQRYVDFSEKDDPAKVPKSLSDPDHFSRETGSVDLDPNDREFYEEYYDETVDDLFDLYENMVSNGVPKEDARFVLPIGTKVNWTMSMNARALLHLADMRATGEAQWEARELAEKVLDCAEDWLPVTMALYDDHGPHKLAP